MRGVHARPDPRPEASRTYQARPRLVASDSRLSPVRGSAQPAPPRASRSFPPSLRFSGSAAAPLGAGFFRLFTSDMSAALRISKPGRLPGGEGGSWDVAASGGLAPSQAVLRRQAARPASGFRGRAEEGGNWNSRARAVCPDGRGRECHVRLGARPRLSPFPLRVRGRSPQGLRGRGPGGARARRRALRECGFACACARCLDWAGPAVFECSAVLRRTPGGSERTRRLFLSAEGCERRGRQREACARLRQATI